MKEDCQSCEHIAEKEDGTPYCERSKKDLPHTRYRGSQMVIWMSKGIPEWCPENEYNA